MENAPASIKLVASSPKKDIKIDESNDKGFVCFGMQE